MSTGPNTFSGVSGLHRTTTQLVRSYLRRVESIPGPEETFIKRDLPPEAAEMFDRFRENSMFHRVEYDEDAEAYRWQLRPAVDDARQRFSTTEEHGDRVTPCCLYRGFSNLRHGGFECGCCGEEFDDFTIVEEAADGE